MEPLSAADTVSEHRVQRSSYAEHASSLAPVASRLERTVAVHVIHPEPEYLHYGDQVRLHGILEIPLGQTNPGGFSWRDYLARRGVYCQTSVKRPGSVARSQATFAP